MRRRYLLKLLGLMAASWIPVTQAQTSVPSLAVANKKRILVLGAGLSGLAAAKQLQDQGHDVIVIEARERIGGRIWTSTKWSDMPLDFGATWIHGVQGNPLTHLADSIHAKRLTTSYDRSITYNTTGRELTTAEESRLDKLKNTVLAAIKKAQRKDPDTSIRQALQPLLSQFDKSSETYRFINFILSSTIEQEYSGSAQKLSTQWYDSAKEFPGDDVLFAQGYKVIVDYLAKGLNIKLGQVAKEIQWQQSSVRVITQKTEFTADHVIVTLPLGVLQSKKVRFTPQLPSNKQNAIAKLGMGVLNKCYLRFPHVFWPVDVDWLEYIPEQHGEWTEWVSFKRAANMPILLGFNAADRGRAIEVWTDQEIVASAMKTLRAIYGENIPEPIDYQITRWATDPFALGSYSYNPVGTTPAMRKTLASSLGKSVFFAGEASDQDYFGTAHGAYLSGLRVANEILAI